jgi:hypothetical protein
MSATQTGGRSPPFRSFQDGTRNDEQFVRGAVVGEAILFAAHAPVVGSVELKAKAALDHHLVLICVSGIGARSRAVRPETMGGRS